MLSLDTLELLSKIDKINSLVLSLVNDNKGFGLLVKEC